MNRFYASLLALVFPLIPCGLNAQEVQQSGDEFSSVLSYMKRAMSFNQQLPQEKVYLHFDNTGYFKGETIWFKAYVVRADKSTMTNMSRVLYVELVNPSGDVIDTRKYQIKDGVADGCFELTNNIFVSGYYEVRAYTRYMTNWGNGGIFSRVFPVFDAPKKEGDYSNPYISTQTYKKRLPNLRSNDTSDTKDIDGNEDKKQSNKRVCVHFYPEGGHLVKGLNSRIAFLVTDNTGLSQELGGLVLDENKQPLNSVSTRRGGRGVFDIVPDGKPKYLRIADADGKQHDFLIPEPEEEGLSLNMNMLRDDDITATLNASPSMVGKLLGYTLMHNGNILIADTVSCEKAFAIPFDRNSMPAGVSQLTFFTSDGHIQAERQFFICPKSKETDSIRITSPMKYTKPCGKIVLNLKALPNSKLSVSAMDAATMVNGKEGNAKTWMLLSSEIKGYIHNPSYYFEADDREHRMEADLLMMIQGWRRYDWALMANAIDSNADYSLFDKKSADFHQPLEDALYIFGTLKEKSKKYDVSKAWLNINLYNREGAHFDGQAKVDANGNYAFEMPEFYGELKTIFNTGVADKNGYWKDANFYVGIDRHFSPARRMLMPGETKLLDINKSNMFNDPREQQKAHDEYQGVKISKREHVLPTVVITARKRIFENARASWQSEGTGREYSSLFYDAEADADVFADNGKEVPTLWEWLHMRNDFFTTNATSDNVTESTTAMSLEESSAPTSVSLDADMNSTSSMNESDLASNSDKGLNGEDLNMDKIEGHGVFDDGLAYKNRPIVWVLNNAFCAITHLGGMKLTDMQELRGTIEPMPQFIDEIKSVYVSENPKAYQGVLMSSMLSGKDPVTVFVYTYASRHRDKKGIRTTIYKGYNYTKTFEMEDYSIYPPMEDFRRTVYWEPNVVTDNNGNARLEFWNNSSIHEMYISAEGIAPNGTVLVNE